MTTDNCLIYMLSRSLSLSLISRNINVILRYVCIGERRVKHAMHSSNGYSPFSTPKQTKKNSDNSGPATFFSLSCHSSIWDFLYNTYAIWCLSHFHFPLLISFSVSFAVISVICYFIISTLYLFTLCVCDVRACKSPVSERTSKQACV